MLIYLLQGMTFGFAAAVQPGPLQTYMISRALDDGWRRALPISFTPLISDGPIIMLVLIVLSQVPVWFVHLLQTVGGLFLLYLAFSTLKSWRDHKTKEPAEVHSGRISILKAATVNLLNPNVYLGWSLVMGPLLMRGWRESPIDGIVVVLGFYCTMVIGGMGIVALFSGARGLGPRVTRGMIGAAGVGLGLLGLFQLWQGTAAQWWQ